MKIKMTVAAAAAIMVFAAGMDEPLQALTFHGQAPHFSDAGAPNAAIETAFNAALDRANDQVARFSRQKKMARSFADANAYSSHTASLWGFQGYDNIALLGGLSMGAQMPALDYDALEKALKEIERKGDAEAGFSPSGSIHLGLHLGWFSQKARDWYLSFKFFMYELSYPLFGYTFNYETMNAGVMVNYSLVRARRFGKGSFLWRGISLGFGFNYQKNEMDYRIKLDNVSETIGGGSDLVIDPSIKIALAMNTYTIPIELVSSLRILYFLNISLGAGVDFNFGDSEVISKSAGRVTVRNADPGWGDETPGYIAGDTSTKGAPFTVHGRLMGGIGLTIGPAVIADVQLTYYLLTGVGVNVSAGFVW
jgi:hypothetical protein